MLYYCDNCLLLLWQGEGTSVSTSAGAGAGAGANASAYENQPLQPIISPQLQAHKHILKVVQIHNQLQMQQPQEWPLQ